MDMKRYYKNIFLWIIPAIMLLLTLVPIGLPAVYTLILQIVVSVTALLIAYLLFTERPRYYVIWGIIFVIILLIYNPLIHLSVTMGVAVPLNLITAILYITNWWFVFRKRM